MPEWLFAGWLALVLSGWIITALLVAFDIWDCENPLKSARIFLGSVFYWQGEIWINTRDNINLAGEIVLQILAAPLTTPISVIMLAVLLIGEVFRFLVWIFMAVFGKKTARKQRRQRLL